MTKRLAFLSFLALLASATGVHATSEKNNDIWSTVTIENIRETETGNVSTPHSLHIAKMPDGRHSLYGRGGGTTFQVTIDNELVYSLASIPTTRNSDFYPVVKLRKGYDIFFQIGKMAGAKELVNQLKAIQKEALIQPNPPISKEEESKSNDETDPGQSNQNNQDKDDQDNDKNASTNFLKKHPKASIGIAFVTVVVIGGVISTIFYKGKDSFPNRKKMPSRRS